MRRSWIVAGLVGVALSGVASADGGGAKGAPANPGGGGSGGAGGLAPPDGRGGVGGNLGPKAPSVVIGPAAVLKGKLTPPQVLRVVRARTSSFYACFQKQLERNPSLSRRYEYVVLLTKAGKTNEVVSHVPSNTDDLDDCSQKVLRMMSFPGGASTFKVAIRFSAN